MKIIKCLALIGLAAMAPAHSAELVPEIANRTLDATLVAISWPDTLPRDFASGLENRILLRMTIVSGSQPVAHADSIVYVNFDLWDEAFRVRLTVGEVERQRVEFKRVQDVIAHLSKLKLTGLFPVSSLPQGAQLVLRADVLINPVEREKIERLRKWVAANSAPNGIGGTPTTTVSSKPNDLFNRIFEQYVAGDDLAAPWKVTVLSKSFDPKMLPAEPHTE